MPFTRISMIAGRTKSEKSGLVDDIYQALRSTFAVAENDRFMAINEYSEEDFIFHPTYLEMNRSNRTVVIEIVCNNTRSVEQKKALYQDLAARISKRLNISADEVVVCLVDVAKVNWSIGQGLMSFA